MIESLISMVVSLIVLFVVMYVIKVMIPGRRNRRELEALRNSALEELDELDRKFKELDKVLLRKEVKE